MKSELIGTALSLSRLENPHRNRITQKAKQNLIVGMHFLVSFLCLGIHQRKEDRRRVRDAVRIIRREMSVLV